MSGTDSLVRHTMPSSRSPLLLRLVVDGTMWWGVAMKYGWAYASGDSPTIQTIILINGPFMEEEEMGI